MWKRVASGFLFVAFLFGCNWLTLMPSVIAYGTREGLFEEKDYIKFADFSLLAVTLASLAIWGGVRVDPGWRTTFSAVCGILSFLNISHCLSEMMKANSVSAVFFAPDGHFVLPYATLLVPTGIFLFIWQGRIDKKSKAAALFHGTDDNEGRIHEQPTAESRPVTAGQWLLTKRKWIVGVFIALGLLLVVLVLVPREAKRLSAVAKRYLLEAAERGNAESQYKIADAYDRGHGVSRNAVEAAKWYRKAADQGHAAAQSSLGYLYYVGEGVTHDNREAVKWYRKAADQGNDDAQSNLAAMYAEGIGVTRDYVEAVRWYRQAADHGHVYAQRSLGWMYSQGMGVTRDEVEAVRWYRKAADQGDAHAQDSLAEMYAKGTGVTQDYGEAVKWYRKAVDQGLPHAQFVLGSMYAEGKGVPQDDVQAYRLIYLSATASKENERPSEAGALLDEIAKKMTTQQLAEAQRLAGESKTKPAQ